MSDKPQSLPCPSPRVCAHEPILREMALAAKRLLSFGPQAHQYGTKFCRAHQCFGGNPCRLCDLATFERGYQLITSEAPWIVHDCVSPQIVERDATIRGLNERVALLLEQARRAEFARDQALSALAALMRAEPRPAPLVCPISGRKFFMTLEHPERGRVATYGGPFDSYTIPEPDEDGCFRSERYDHDRGQWMTGGEPERFRILTDTEHNELWEDARQADSLRAALAYADAEIARLRSHAGVPLEDAAEWEAREAERERLLAGKA